jgi:hypothetical protein
VENELYQKVLKSLTDPAAIILFLVCLHLVREGFKKDAVISKLLKAQEDRGVILTKITVMLEAMFNDSRRPK